MKIINGIQYIEFFIVFFMKNTSVSVTKGNGSRENTTLQKGRNFV